LTDENGGARDWRGDAARLDRIADELMCLNRAEGTWEVTAWSVADLRALSGRYLAKANEAEKIDRECAALAEAMFRLGRPLGHWGILLESSKKFYRDRAAALIAQGWHR